MKHLFTFILLVCLLISEQFFAQEKNDLFWGATNESQIENTCNQQIIPKKFLVYKLNGNTLKDQLYSAPHEKRVSLNESPCIVSLPLPNGSFQKFRVVNSPVMAEELQASFPDIKTFSIRGIDDKHATGKLDLNEFGFHGMVNSPEGDFFIDPYCVGNTTHYITYYTKDFQKDPKYINPEEGVVKDVEEKKPAQKKSEDGSNVELKSQPAPCMGTDLRTYRLAVACTGEYAKAATGLNAPTLAQTLAKVVTTVNRVDGVYEKEVAIRLLLIPATTLVLYTDPATDTFTGTSNNNGSQLLNLSQIVITNSIGTANYDIGHTFSTGAGGIASYGCVCNANSKARGVTGSGNPVGDPYDIDYVAHEMGHQFAGSHTFNSTTGGCGGGNRVANTAVEPGSGVTIMAYAGLCGSNDLAPNSIPYFHAISFDEIVNFTNFGPGGACPVITSTGNNPPVVLGTGVYVIPKGTPFVLTGSATDPDNDPLTYSWEEVDGGGSTGSNWNSGLQPFFRSYDPVLTPMRLFPRGSVVATNNYTNTKGEYLPQTPQVLQFRLTARDNKMGGGGVCYAFSDVTVDNSGPFKVLYPSATGILWPAGSLQTVSWDPAGTDVAPVSCDSVRILISTNSGNTYSVLVNSTPNFGFLQINVPNITNTITTCRIKVEAVGNIFYDVGDNNFTIAAPGSFVGISAISENNPVALAVWPNPAEDALTISAGNLNAQTVTSVVIIDVLGKTILEKNYTGKRELRETLDISDFNSGIYFVSVKNEGKHSLHRIIKN